MSTFSTLRKALRSYLPKEQIDYIYTAYQFAKKAHKKQLRSSGKPYISHPLSVATILAEMRMDTQSITAAILHDVIEDTDITRQMLSEKFGEVITRLVEGLSKLTQIHFESRAEAQAENFRKMMIAMTDDIRIILIRLADRLHNMRTLQHLPPHKRRRIAKETLEIYAPIANRLGMNNFRIEFEELGFEKLHPMRCKILQKAIKKARGNRKSIINIIDSALQNALKKSSIKPFALKGREKHLYSIYKKMRHRDVPFAEIMDLYAFRVIVHSVDECYRALGIVHNLYKPFPKRFKDYIAIPKANGYQSLHTILFGPYGVPVEIQIRTEEMDKMAENGIASHWLYKTEENIASQAQLHAREWIKNLLELQQNAGNSLEFIENVKIDLFPDEVYVFTPQGLIIELPTGATAVDFAYKVHSDIGNSCVAAKIDRHLTPLSSVLKNGQTIEIICSPGASPNPSWLNFVVTAKARSRIRSYLKHQKRSESIVLGRRLLDKSLDNLGTSLHNLPTENLENIIANSKYKMPDDLFEDIGLGNQMPQIIARRLINLKDFQIAETAGKKQLSPLNITGAEGVVVNFAKCCYPIPDDPLAGILTKEHGIVVHRETCKNLSDTCRKSEKCIPLRWEKNVQGEFAAELLVEAVNTHGLLASLSLAAAQENASINNVFFDERDENCLIITFILSVHDRKHLAHVIRRFKRLKNVMKVMRSGTRN